MPAGGGLAAACPPLTWPGAGPMFPMCEDQDDTKARACPGYAPGQGLSQ